MKPEPIRLQLSRRKDWRIPPNTVKVDRTTRWGNPFRLDLANGIDASTSVLLYKAANSHPSSIARIKTELRGKNLACWCKIGAACHADWLLKIANE